MKELLGFNKFVIPQIITIVYWVCLVCIIISGLIGAISAVSNGAIVGVFVALFGIVIGILMLRVMCEMTIVIFKINDNLQKIADSQ